MVGVAQLVERQTVDLDVAGSNPVTHPIFILFDLGRSRRYYPMNGSARGRWASIVPTVTGRGDQSGRGTSFAHSLLGVGPSSRTR